MPTYTFKCKTCGRVSDIVSSIAYYSSGDFIPPQCHEASMERFFTAPDPARALEYLTSDAIYDGLKAPDGTDISTRAKHREYMRLHNLTTVDDFKETWVRQERERAAVLAGQDPSRVWDVVDAVNRLER